ncbi:MAG: N-acetylneuraminate synthase family protein [Phycisphaerae bacterium]
MERVEPRTVPVADRLIGPGQRVFVIAEAGVNHDGALTRALALVDAARDAGADAVKFQVFDADELATRAAGAADYQRAAGCAPTQRDLLRRLELSDADFARIRAHCDATGVLFLATPFGVRDLARLLELAPPAIKLASTDLNHVPLARAAAATGLPVIVSTGAATYAEIEAARARWNAWDAADRLILMHCVSCYPTPVDAANLRAIASLHALSGAPVGFSDHTTSIETGAWAAAAGACVLEKHLTHDRDAAGPDHAASLEPAAFRAYVARVRAVEAALGSGALGHGALENDVRVAARRSVVAAIDLPAGVRLDADLLAVKRPAGGIGPEDFDDLIGRRLAVAVARDTPLVWSMLL